WLPAITYDPAIRGVLLYGGASDVGIGPDTWSFANGSWSNITATSGASPPNVAALVYDPALGVVVGFGDVNGYGVTFEFVNGGWLNVTAPGGPDGRTRVMMTYDPADSAVLLCGGDNGSGTQSFNDTWEFGSTGWKQLVTAVAPSTRARGDFAWDPALNAAVLFGGFPVYGQPDFNQTWEFSHDTWTQLALPVAPSARDGSSFVYDPNVGAIVLYGGFYTNTLFQQGILGDTWYFNGTWTQVYPTQTPLSRALSGTVFDPDLNAIFLFGGYDFPTPLGDDWAWVQNLTAPTIRASTVEGEVGVPVQFNVSIAGGLGPFTENWTFGDGGSASGLAVVHIFLSLRNYDVNVTVRDVNNTSAEATLVFGVGASVLQIGPVTASVTEAVVGVSDSFAASPTGGLSPYNWSWSFGDGGSAFGPSPVHTFDAPASWNVTAIVRDADGAQVSSSLVLPVAASALHADAPTVLAPPIQGTAAQFSVSVTGGTAPYNLTWSFGDGTVGYGASPTHTYQTVGTFPVRVTARDAYGLETNASANVSVQASSTTTPGGGSTGSGLPWWVWVGVVVVGVAAGLAGVLYYRKGRSGPPSTAPPPKDGT
ncbi:MAG: PKD domain-containing protein, partial [Thermoplasmata archaeon]|nr:PKD domain-containing protein [Thermoplasmata archaeon]